MNQSTASAASTLLHCYTAAVHSVQPEAALRAPLREAAPGAGPCWIIGVGKAAHGMTRAVVDWLAEHGREPAGGIVVAADPLAAAHPALRTMVGDHPIPGPASARAAAAIADTIVRIPPDAEVHIAISGGASALMAGPLPSISTDDLTSTFRLLISSGLDIREMNAVRKRVTRWSAGRLALSLAPRHLHVWIISDVMGDDLGSIASGPCTADPWTAADVRDILSKRGLLNSLPESVQQSLTRETPKPSDPWLAAIVPRIVATNGMARAAAANAATGRGMTVRLMPDPLRGEAAPMGREIAAAIANHAGGPEIWMWGGETTVTIAGTGGLGGRSQELALAAAQELRGGVAVILAAGTDGRDGPTDAAGALVDGATWQRIVAGGRDPAADLARHDAYPALDLADALIRTGPSGTNVMDLAFAFTGWA